VRLHEARELAGGASGRNGGFALRGLAMPYDAACRQLGAVAARTLMSLTEAGLRRLAEHAGDAFRPVGSLRLAADEAELEALHGEYAALAADGFAAEVVGELAPPLDRLYAGALLHPGDGALEPARWVRRLAHRACEAGADIHEHSPITVGEAAVQADAVVVCVDGGTAALLPELAPFARPTRGQVLVTEPLPDLWYPRLHYARAGYDYWQQLPGGRLVAGGCRDVALEDEYSAAEETTAPVQAAVEDLVARLAGRRPRITHRWAGTWGETPDLLPLVGAVPGRDAVHVAGGYSGHGNVLGFVCGELVARSLLGDPVPELGELDPARFYSSS
jgi:glycine/D-amino acid oxidase-like deaminating enzyme